METSGQIYIADDDTPQSDIQRYKDAVREQGERVEYERFLREQNPDWSSRRVRRAIERKFSHE